MKIIKTSEKSNLLLERKELTFIVDHQSQGTPKLTEIRANLASMFEVSEELIYVIKLDTSTGTNRTLGEAEIYEKIDHARSIVPTHIQLRNRADRSTQTN